MNSDEKVKDEVSSQDMEEMAEEEEIKRISQLNPPTGCGRDEDRFNTK